MKKVLAVLLALVMVFALCACGEEEVTQAAQQVADAVAENSDEIAAAVSEVEAAVEAATGMTDASGVKIGLITLHDENSTYDKNFIDAFVAACEATGAEYVIKSNIPEGQECYDTACDMADDGCNIVFADSFGHEDYMIQAAQEYPEVEFCHATGTQAHTAGLSNFHNAFASIYEGRYLAGIAAGMKLNEMIENGEITEDEAKMGYVGAFTYAEVMSGYTSFYLGAKSVCPSVTMEVTFTGSWYDETAEKEGANTLINDGCVLISQHADSWGAPTACETAGVPDVSYNGSTESACPNTFIISSRINWQPYFELIINAVANGEEIPADWTGTLETGSVEITDLGAVAPAEGTQEAIDAAREAMLAGTLHVFDTTTFTVDGEELASYMADVDTDAAYEKDTEVIVDGYFSESTFRSAPYFDVQIDGITLLDTAF